MTASEIIVKLKKALKEFGTYSFDDKGASEVMDLEEIVRSLAQLSGTEAGKIMKEVATKHDRGQQLINELSICLDFKEEDWFEDMITVSGAEY